jgi:excisionase family DNA binding protein
VNLHAILASVRELERVVLAQIAEGERQTVAPAPLAPSQDPPRLKLLEAKDVAQDLGYSVDRVYSLVRDGLLPAIRIGSRYKFDPRALDEWVRNGGKGLQPKENARFIQAKDPGAPTSD